MVRILAVVVTYNSSATISRCLDSIDQSLGSGLVETIVVDNGSTDETVPIVRRWSEAGEGRALLNCESNPGFGGGVNRGVETASKAWDALLLVNPDCFVSGAQLRCGAGHITADGLDIVGFNQVDDYGEQCKVRQPLPNKLSLAIVTWRTVVGRRRLDQLVWLFTPVLARTRWRSKVLDPSELGIALGTAEFVSASLLLFARPSWEALGGFDDSYFMYCEDADLVARARKLKLVPGFCSAEPPSVHLVGASGGASLYASPEVIGAYRRYHSAHHVGLTGSAGLAVALLVSIVGSIHPRKRVRGRALRAIDQLWSGCSHQRRRR